MPRVSVELPAKGITGWVEFRDMTIDDLEIYAEAEDNPAAFIRMIKTAATEYEFSNGKSIGEQPRELLTPLFRSWNKKQDDDSIPPANGQHSDTPS